MPPPSNPMTVCLLGCPCPLLWRSGDDSPKRAEEAMGAGVAQRRAD